jgi:hypothetical protein
LAECGNQSLRKPEAEHQLWTSHQQLRDQAFEESRGTFVASHACNNAEPRLRVIEVSILNTRLNNVERSRNDEGGTSAADGSDEVLSPRCRVVVF